jgi:restriction system protein
VITTSSFTAEALEYVQKIGKAIVLVDGSTLARLMIEHGVGVSVVDRYVTKRVDEDFFESESFSTSELSVKQTGPEWS